jgi:hypothetical protein
MSYLQKQNNCGFLIAPSSHHQGYGRRWYVLRLLQAFPCTCNFGLPYASTLYTSVSQSAMTNSLSDSACSSANARLSFCESAVQDSVPSLPQVKPHACAAVPLVPVQCGYQISLMTPSTPAKLTNSSQIAQCTRW